MIDLTPLDVRKKKGDFQRVLRGYDPGEVDTFLGLVEARLEALVKENLGLTDRVQHLASQIEALEGREKAVQDALVTAQKLREDVQDQSKREAESLREQAAREAESLREQTRREAESLREQTRREAESLRGEAHRESAAMKDRARREAELLRKEIVADIEARLREAEGLLKERQRALEELERSRRKFLKGFRSLLEREMDSVEVEEARRPLEDTPLELDLKGWRRIGEEEPGTMASEQDLPGGSPEAASPVDYGFEPVIDFATPMAGDPASSVEGWGAMPGDEPPQGEFNDIVPVGVLDPAPEPPEPVDPGPEEEDEGEVSSAEAEDGEVDLELEEEPGSGQHLHPGDESGERDQPDAEKMDQEGVDADFASRVKELLDSRSRGKAKPSSEPLWLSSLLEKDGKAEKAKRGRGEAGSGEGHEDEASVEGTGGDEEGEHRID